MENVSSTPQSLNSLYHLVGGNFAKLGLISSTRTGVNRIVCHGLACPESTLHSFSLGIEDVDLSKL